MTKTDVIKDNHYPCFVLASAGTGKTETIARKVEDLVINQNVDLDKIALITFTNKATAETTARIQNKIYNAWANGNKKMREQVDKFSMSKISTIHAFCDSILREYGAEIGISPNYRISNLTIEKDKLANQIVSENYVDHIYSVLPTFRVARLLREVEETASDKGIEIRQEEFEEANFWDTFRYYFFDIYQIYTAKLENLKKERGIITTNDLLTYIVKLLKNEKIAKEIASDIKYLFLDEAQDINFSQEEIIEQLIHYGVKTMVVGDEKQSIYAFRGSDKRAFNKLVDFIKEHDGIEYKLLTNYRSNKFIIDRINNLFDREFHFHGDKLEFNNQKLVESNLIKDDKKAIEIVFEEKIQKIVKKLAYSLQNGIHPCYNKIAILGRTNRDVIRTYKQLYDAGIPCQIYVNRSLYKSKIVRDLIKVLNYISGSGELQRHELFYTDLYLSATKSKIAEESFYLGIDCSIKAFKQNDVVGAILQCIESCELLQYYESTNNKQGIANIQRFIEIVRDLVNDGMTGFEIAQYLNIMVVSGAEEPQPQIIDGDNAVIVSTIHMFKGLDRDTIIVNDVDNNLLKMRFADFYYDEKFGLCFNKEELIPSNDEVPYDTLFEERKKSMILENLEEELRVMYVMMTRAKKKLVLRSNKAIEKVDFKSKILNYVSFLNWLYDIQY